MAGRYYERGILTIRPHYGQAQTFAVGRREKGGRLSPFFSHLFSFPLLPRVMDADDDQGPAHQHRNSGQQPHNVATFPQVSCRLQTQHDAGRKERAFVCANWM